MGALQRVWIAALVALMLPLAASADKGREPEPLQTGEADLQTGPETAVTVMGADEASRFVAEADSAYDKGDFDEAVELYSRVARSYPAGAGLLFNLGNAYYKAGDEGEARLCLERAKRLDPSNKSIDQNIEYIASRVRDANKAELKGKKGNVEPDVPGYFGRLRKSIAVDSSSDAWAEMAATSFILLLLALALYFFTSKVKFKKIGFFSALIFVFFTVVFIVFAEMAASTFESQDEGVVSVFKAQLTDEPSAGATHVGFPLHRGTKLQILDTALNPEGEKGWYKVRLNHSNTGWIKASELTVI